MCKLFRTTRTTRTRTTGRCLREKNLGHDIWIIWTDTVISLEVIGDVYFYERAPLHVDFTVHLGNYNRPSATLDSWCAVVMSSRVEIATASISFFSLNQFLSAPQSLLSRSRLSVGCMGANQPNSYCRQETLVSWKLDWNVSVFWLWKRLYTIDYCRCLYLALFIRVLVLALKQVPCPVHLFSIYYGPSQVASLVAHSIDDAVNLQ